MDFDAKHLTCGEMDREGISKCDAENLHLIYALDRVDFGNRLVVSVYKILYIDI